VFLGIPLAFYLGQDHLEELRVESWQWHTEDHFMMDRSAV
jgi:hypothetical protein